MKIGQRFIYLSIIRDVYDKSKFVQNIKRPINQISTKFDKNYKEKVTAKV